LTALGQVMLYVDGMNGVINHNSTIQWLYKLLASKVTYLIHSQISAIFRIDRKMKISFSEFYNAISDEEVWVMIGI